MTAALEGSLKRLQTDYVDLYQLHWPERTTNFFSKLGYKHNESEGDWTPFETILETAQKFIDQGKIRYLGLSNETPYGLSKYLQLSESKNLPRVVSVQNPYSLVNRTYEVGLAEMSIREQAGLLAYSPLAFGMLSGKYLNNQMPEGSRLQLFGSHFPRYQGTRTQLAVEEYFKVAQKYNLSLAQMSLAFVNAQPFVTSNIIGATSMEQLKENIESINLDLSDEIMEEINIIHENNPSPAP
jgi:aryl-alcohol dehydrogenase-like predicted oxidoreductase